ncbi:MAG: phosphotransferase [Gammaproteobacteria bacterium]
MTSEASKEFRRFSEPEAEELARRYFHLIGSATVLNGEIDQNFLISVDRGDKYVLKISPQNSDRNWLTCQAELLDHLQSKQLNIATPKPIRDINKNYVSEHVSGEHAFPLRMLAWIEGGLLDVVEHYDEQLLQNLGQSVAAVDMALRDFTHPATDRHLRWDTRNVMELESSLAAINNRERRKLAVDLLGLLPQKLLTQLKQFPRFVIHNDGGNQHNMLVTKHDKKWRVNGIIDFGDAVLTHRVLGLGIACAYASFSAKSPKTAISFVTRGYMKVATLSRGELAVVPWATIARWLATVIVAARRATSEPDNSYAQVSAEPAWSALETLIEHDIDGLGFELAERNVT